MIEVEIDVLLEKMNGFTKMDKSEIQAIKERIKELERVDGDEEIRRALAENERRTLISLLNRIASKRLTKLVNSAVHEMIFEERIIDLSNAMEFEKQFYESLLVLMRNYWKNWEVDGDE